MKTPLTNAVRAAIEGCGVSRYRLAKASGVSQALLSRFIHGQVSLSLRSLDRLAPVLGLKIVARGPVRVPPPAKRGRKPKRKRGAKKRKGKRT